MGEYAPFLLLLPPSSRPIIHSPPPLKIASLSFAPSSPPQFSSAPSRPFHLRYALPQHPIRAFQIAHHALQPLKQNARLVPLRVDAARQRFVLGLRLGDLRDELGVGRGEVGG